jgi:putative transposase
MMRRAYQSDLSDAEWAYLKPHLPSPKHGGRLRVHTVRETLGAIFYVVRGGCAWRLLPHDFPPWETVYYYYYRIWRIDGSGSGCTRLYAGGRGYDSGGTRNRVPESSIRSR